MRFRMEKELEGGYQANRQRRKTHGWTSLCSLRSVAILVTLPPELASPPRTFATPL